MKKEAAVLYSEDESDLDKWRLLSSRYCEKNFTKQLSP